MTYQVDYTSIDFNARNLILHIVDERISHPEDGWGRDANGHPAWSDWTDEL